MADATHWDMIEKPSDLDPKGWALMAYPTLGGTVSFTLPAATNPCRLKLLKGDDDAVTLEILDVAAKHTMTFDLVRDHPARMTFDGKGCRLLFPTTRVTIDQPDTTPFACIIVSRAEDETAGFKDQQNKIARAMPASRLYRVILPVPDIERATAFYRAVLGAPGIRVSPGRHYFDCGGTILACYDPAADGDPHGHGWHFHPLQYLYFAVADLDEVPDRVRAAGGTIDAGIETMPWGERLLYARDPFGSRISFVDERTLFTG